MKHWIKKCSFMIVCVLLAGCGRSEVPHLDTAETQTQAIAEEKQAADAPVEHSDTPVLIYVCGEVVSPGVYELKKGMRICDAVEAAGGFTTKASQEYWNLAEPLTDGQMIYFPTEEEAKERQESAGEKEESAGQKEDGRININTADTTQLMSIPGIGQTRAEAIIAYRKEHGAFAQIEDIMNVSGIKNALFNKMKEYITIR